MEIDTKVWNWFRSDDTGISSLTLASILSGVSLGKYYDRPYDPADFGRCYRLLQTFPEWKSRLNEIPKHYPSWKPFIENWDRMVELYLEEVETGTYEKLYHFMKDLEKLIP